MSAPISRARASRLVRRADRDRSRGARDPGQGDGAQADGADALHDDRVAQPDLGALGDVHRRQQAAAAADVVVERDGVRQARHGHAGLEVDRLRPSAEEPLVRGIGDAVDAARGQRVGVRWTVHARQRPHVRWTSKNTTRSPSRIGDPSIPVTGPRAASTTPAETWPGMIGYGTPARRPCQRCTSVPQTSEQRRLAAGRRPRAGPAGETRGPRSAAAARSSPRQECCSLTGFTLSLKGC